MCAVAISSGITTVNDYQKQKQFADLNKISEDRKIVSLFNLGECFERRKTDQLALVAIACRRYHEDQQRNGNSC